MYVNLLQDLSGIGIANYPFGFFLGSEIGSSLVDLIYSETWPHVVGQLIMYIPPGSKLTYPELFVSLLRVTFAVPPSGYCPKFLPPPSEECLTYPSQSMLVMNISVT